MKRVCVIGGGINGAGIAWELVRRGYSVILFEKGSFGGATSSATTKMIHGGLRYLETGSFRLVRESLRERAFLLQALPDLVRPLPIAIPIYGDSPRAWLTVRAGLFLYDRLAGRSGVAPSGTLDPEDLVRDAGLRREGMRNALLYHDAQVDDRALVQRVIAAASRDGLDAREHTAVLNVADSDGGWYVTGSDSTTTRFDILVNAVGPWMNEHLDRFALPSNWRLTLIRGSHLVLRRAAPPLGTLIQTRDGRVVFVLPWKTQLLVGTTEVPHHGSLDRVSISQEEIDYLLEGFNRYFAQPATESEIESTFSGVRPLIESRANPSRISREARVELRPRMVNVFGGKLTTFLSLARKTARAVDRVAGVRTTANPPIF